MGVVSTKCSIGSTYRAKRVSLQVHTQVPAAFDAQDGNALPGLGFERYHTCRRRGHLSRDHHERCLHCTFARACVCRPACVRALGVECSEPTVGAPGCGFAHGAIQADLQVKVAQVCGRLQVDVPPRVPPVGANQRRWVRSRVAEVEALEDGEQQGQQGVLHPESPVYVHHGAKKKKKSKERRFPAATSLML